MRADHVFPHVFTAAMDSNKDEAQRCIDLAEQAFTEGKIERAEKFLLKAEKLYPTDKAKRE